MPRGQLADRGSAQPARLPGQRRAAQAVGFTHDRELPGVAPTRRRAEILAISVGTVQRSLVASCRTL